MRELVHVKKPMDDFSWFSISKATGKVENIIVTKNYSFEFLHCYFAQKKLLNRITENSTPNLPILSMT